MSARGSSGFSPGAVFALVLFGAGVFVALLWMIGAGMGSREPNDGGAHVGGKGLNGYAAIADLLEKHGHAVTRSRSEAALDDPGLLVITPLPNTDADKLDKIIAARRYAGPTMLVLSKWLAMQLPPAISTGKTKVGKGWTFLAGTASPEWGNKVKTLGPLDLQIVPHKGRAAQWTGLGRSSVPAPAKELQSLAMDRPWPKQRASPRQGIAEPVLGPDQGVDPRRRGPDAGGLSR